MFVHKEMTKNNRHKGHDTSLYKNKRDSRIAALYEMNNKLTQGNTKKNFINVPKWK